MCAPVSGTAGAAIRFPGHPPKRRPIVSLAASRPVPSIAWPNSGGHHGSLLRRQAQDFQSAIAARSACHASIRILIWADPIAVAVLIAAVVVGAAIIGGTCRRCSDSCGAVGRSSVDASASRCTRHRMPCNTVASGMNGPAAGTNGSATEMSAASMESPSPNTAATAGERIVGNESCANQHTGCQSSESITNHDIFLLTLRVPCTLPGVGPRWHRTTMLAERFEPKQHPSIFRCSSFPCSI